MARNESHRNEPSNERILEAGAATARDTVALRAELLAELVVREEQAMARSASRPAHYGRHNGGDANQRAVPLRTEVLCSESRWAEALALVRPPAYCRDGVLAYLARRLGPEHLAQRIELPMRVFASEMHNSKTPHRRERGHVEEIAGLLDATQRTSWLLQLRLEYKAKKNFVRDLPER